MIRLAEKRFYVVLKITTYNIAGLPIHQRKMREIALNEAEPPKDQLDSAVQT